MQDELRKYSRHLRGHINILCNTSAQMEFYPPVLALIYDNNPLCLYP